MLIKASVENFKSFDSLTELTMISSSKIRTPAEDIPKYKVEISGASVLKSAAIYGANAAGKSNLVEFFRFFQRCVKGGMPLYAAQSFCKTRKENETRESTFEMQISIDGKSYAYGFSAVLSSRTITAEWCFELLQNGTAKNIFKREANGKPEIDQSVKLSSEEKTKFNVYADDFDPSKPILFLTEMNRGKRIDQKSKLACFVSIYNWITESLIVLTPSMPITDFQCYYNEESLALINKLIATFDTGISCVKVEEISFEELSTYLPKQMLNDVMDNMKEKVDATGKADVSVSMRSENSFFNIKMVNGGEPLITTLRLQHGNSFFDYEFKEESDGTRRLFDLIDMLVNADENTVYVVDELERSLHPKLTFHFIELFMDLHKGQNIQLIFTTHESAIMDQSLFRRDEIWFVERDAENCSSIYSLDKFKERYDKKLSKAYLEGRYGAIPIFSTFQSEGGK